MSKVLVVDDQWSIRRLINDILADEFEILQAGTADEAVKLAAEYKPEIILLDLGLPEIDGIEVLPLLKNLVPDSRIIIVTGIIDNSVKKKALSLGASGFIGKPFDIFKMKSFIQDIVMMQISKS